MRSVALVLAGVALLLPPTSHAATWNVTPDGTGDFPTIQAAVDAAVDGDEILLADGTFAGVGNHYVSFLGKAITIRSASGNADACLVNWGPGYGWRGFRFESAEGRSSILADLSIISTGSPYTVMGGVIVVGASPTIRGVNFRSGFALISSGGAPLIEDSVLENGSNMLIAEGSTPVIRGCVLEAGSFVHSRGRIRVVDSALRMEDCAAHEGPIFATRSSAEFEGCDLNETSVDVSGTGGGLLIEDCRITGGEGCQLWSRASSFVVRDSAFKGSASITNNSGASLLVEGCDLRGSGSGIWSHGGDVTVRGCLLAGNTVAGIDARVGYGLPSATLTLEDCTIASNGNAPYARGGVYLGPNMDAVIRRTIVWGNSSKTGSEIWIEDGSLELDCVTLDLAGIGGGGTVSVSGELLETDPLFCSPVPPESAPTPDGDYALHQGSPALGAACGPMGGLGEGCGPSSVETESWGKIKSMYR